MTDKALPTKVLTGHEEKALRDKVRELEDVRDGVEVVQGLALETKDKPGIEKEITRLKGALQAHSVAEIDLSPAEKMAVEKELAELTAFLQKDMPTWGEHYGLHPRDGARYHALVAQIVQWEADPIRRGKVARWKTLRRLRDPHNPKASSTMYLFPQSKGAL